MPFCRITRLRKKCLIAISTLAISFLLLCFRSSDYIGRISLQVQGHHRRCNGDKNNTPDGPCGGPSGYKFPSIVTLGNDPWQVQGRHDQTPRTGLKICPQVVSGGQVTTNDTAPSWSELRARYPDVQSGGKWRPAECLERYRVAIIIPYRNRDSHLRIFLRHMHSFLQNQQLQYQIYVAEQSTIGEFNRGLARNVGFLEAMKLDGADCVVFHDVDLLPLDTRNYYGCSDIPRHLCVAVDYIDNFKPLYVEQHAIFGGVVSFRTEQFREVNGYSNLYFGWGAEDDDLYYRAVAKGYTPYRYPHFIGRYHGIPHHSEKKHIAADPDKIRLFRMSKEREGEDGLNSAPYRIRDIQRRNLYTWIHFDVTNEKQLRNNIREILERYRYLYGNLPPNWGQFMFTPHPFWWRNMAGINRRFLRYVPESRQKEISILENKQQLTP